MELAASGPLAVYNFTDRQTNILGLLKSLRVSMSKEPPASTTRTILMDTYDSLFRQLAIDVGSNIIKPEIQKDIT